MKLVRLEPETPALRAFLNDAGLVGSEILLAEVPRAIRRASASEPSIDATALLARADEVLGVLGLHPLDRVVLEAAGAIAEPALRALDAIHIAAAADMSPLDGFVTYDRRQAAAARLAGLVTYMPA